MTITRPKSVCHVLVGVRTHNQCVSAEFDPVSLILIETFGLLLLHAAAHGAMSLRGSNWVSYVYYKRVNSSFYVYGTF